MIIDGKKLFNRFLPKIYKILNIQNDPIYSKRFLRFLKFFTEKFIPIVFKITSFIIMVWIFNRIDTKYGIEKVLIVGLVIIIFSLDGIADRLTQSES